MTREQKIAEARQLQDKGLGYREIAGVFGVGVGTAYRWLNDEYAERERAACRINKERYRGVCSECGGPTWGSQPGHAADVCATCRGLSEGDIARTLRLYDEGLSAREIAEQAGRHVSTIDKRLRKYGANRRPRGEAIRLAFARKKAAA